MSLVHERSLPNRASVDVDDWLGCASENTLGLITRLEQEVRKHEQEARLAAEIGQTLLQNHEILKREAHEARSELEKKIERVKYLERVVADQDQAYQDLLEKHHKVIWESRKTRQTLQETVEDLDAANHRNMQLSNELKTLNSEVAGLRTFKVKASKREEGLRAKLDDIKQELAVARKAERSLESQQKKLKTRYETLSGHYERLKLNSHTRHQDNSNIIWLREYNDRLRSDMAKLTTPTVEPPDLEEQQPHYLIHIVRELVAVNNNLKRELLASQQQQQHQQQQLDEYQALATSLSHSEHGKAMAKKYLDKLRDTDLRILNRQRHQPFNILDLTETSNDMIQAILDTIDLDGIPAINADLLSEIGHLRMALNEMQCEYVRKVEQQVDATTAAAMTPRPFSASGTFNWLANIFPSLSSTIKL
ncbi:hypothetical protein BX666DRAFT_1978179 [Dichotomocladium elegans]|nr:hypothetical protein BX666DRAFT_1978179 [Dichotomocladium elegans]